MDVARGGRETSTAQIARSLARRGHEVTILCQDGQLELPGVDLACFGRRGALRACQLKNFVADVQEEIAGGFYDVVHAMLPVPGADVVQFRGGTVPAQQAGSLRRRRGLGWLVAVAVAPLKIRQRAMAELERQVAADPAVRLLAVSEMVAGELDRYYGRSEGVRVVYNAVDVPDPAGRNRLRCRELMRMRLGVGDGAVVFLAIATNFELKGIQETIEAFACWRRTVGSQREARLVIVGREEPEGYERIAAMRDVGPEVIFEPPTRRIFDWYAAADVCVLLSWYDPCSRVVLEATRWGIPSITTVFNGAAEVIAPSGRVVSSPRDRRGVVAAMEALADPDTRSERERMCRELSDGLSIPRHVDELLEVYAEVAPAGPEVDA